MTNIEKEFKKNKDSFMLVGYKDDKAVLETRNNTEVMAFNIWAMLKKADPPLDEIRIRYMSDEEVTAWEEGE